MRQLEFSQDVSLFCGFLSSKYKPSARDDKTSCPVNSFECNNTKAVKFKSVVGSFRLSSVSRGLKLETNWPPKWLELGKTNSPLACRRPG